MKVGTLYATPFGESIYPEANDLCHRLETLFLDYEKQGNRFRNEMRRDTQNGPLFESKFDLFYRNEPSLVELREFCHLSLARLINQISDYSEEEFQQLNFDYHAWFHITRAGGFQGGHNHPNASWSGIFCVNPGDKLCDRPDSGQVRFHDPRIGANYYSDAGSERWKSPFHIGGRPINHERGKLVMFPSFLWHEIFPYLGDKNPRIVVAFNCRVTRR